jgi:hypothetical protein
LTAIFAHPRSLHISLATAAIPLTWKPKALPIDRLNGLHDLVDAPGGIALQVLGKQVDIPLQRIRCIVDSVLIRQLVVAVVGPLSPGESSLVNTLIGDYLLPLAITPEAGLPAELRCADIRK